VLDAHVYIVHTSCEEAVREAVNGKLGGVKVWIETLIQYLVTDKTTPNGPISKGPSLSCRRPARTSATRTFYGTASATG